MKRKIIVTLLAVAMLTAATITAHAVPPTTDNPLNGYAVTIHDWNTPATFAGGKNWPITTWYFFDAEGNTLGSISGKASLEITHRYQNAGAEIMWEFWFTDDFNEYRGLKEATDSAPPIAIKPILDTKSWAQKVIVLTNAEREEYGLRPLEVDAELMELAQIRAEEVSTKYSHEKPDGTTVVEAHGCGENVGARASAEKQMTGWMNSEGHRNNILLERCKSIGVGC